MAVTPNSIISVQTPNRGHVQILPADTTTEKTAYTAGANGSKITGVVITSTDTQSRTLRLSITNGGTSYPLGVAVVPAGSGSNGIASSVNALSAVASPGIPGLPVDSDGNPYLLLVSGDTLTVSVDGTVTVAKAVTISVIAAGDF